MASDLRNDQHQQLQCNINTFGTQQMAEEWEILSHHSTLHFT